MRDLTETTPALRALRIKGVACNRVTPAPAAAPAPAGN